MKKIYLLLLILICSSGVLISQDFSVIPNPASVEGVASGQPLVAIAELVNNTYESQTVIWKRIVEDLPEGWTTNVCTSEGCALTEVSEGSFSMIPLEGLNVDIQFNSESIGGIGLVEMELYFESDPDNIIYVTYDGNALATQILEAKKSVLEIYPNPVENFFEIKGSENVHQIKIINILGVHTLVSNNPYEKIYVDHLPCGTYQVAFFDEEGVLLKIRPLVVF